MKIHVLIDNRKNEGTEFDTEGGFSLWIEQNGHGILYDMGMSDKMFLNAQRLGIDISSAECAIISHGHFDHVGGLREFLELNKTALVYLHPEAWRKHLSNTTGTLRSIGMDPDLMIAHPERFISVNHTMDMGKLYFIVPLGEKKHFVPSGNRVLFEEWEGMTAPDQFFHEIIFAIHDHLGLSVFSGCSHQGIENVMEAVGERFPDIPVRAFFGGFHMTNPATGKLSESEETVRTIAVRLLNYNVACYYTGHCTGIGAYNIMKEVMGEKINILSAGEIVEM